MSFERVNWRRIVVLHVVPRAQGLTLCKLAAGPHSLEWTSKPFVAHLAPLVADYLRSVRLSVRRTAVLPALRGGTAVRRCTRAGFPGRPPGYPPHCTVTPRLSGGSIRMPRHRAPTRAHRCLATFALTGAAVGVSLIHPSSAVAATPVAGQPRPADLPVVDDSDDSPADDRARPPRHRAHPEDRGHTDRRSERARDESSRGRPMSSGERQYRNGCRQGYINQGCERFDAAHLLRRGIDPYL